MSSSAEAVRQVAVCPLGLEYTTENAEAVDHLHEALFAILSYSLTPKPHLERAMECDPKFVMAIVCQAFMLLPVGGLATDKDAEEFTQSVGCTDDLTWREKRHVEAIHRKVADDQSGAVEIWEDILLKFPTDVLALRSVYQSYFFTGDSVNMRDCIARVLPAWNESMPGYAYVLSMYSFGLEESGVRMKAKAVAEQSLAINPDLPWSIHALAHVYDELYPPEEGIVVLNKWTEHWVDGGLGGHLTWHLCLFHLDNGDLAGALQRYDDVLKEKATDVFGLVDAVSLLWRIECAGFSPGEDRWLGMQEKMKAMSDQHCMAWYDLHIMMAFTCRSAKDHAARLLVARSLLQSLKEYGNSGKGFNCWVTNEVGVPLCEALLAFANEEYGKVVSLMVPVRYKSHTLGWSVAQRQIISVTLIRAAIHAKNFHLARALLSEIRELRPNHKATAKLLAIVQDLYEEGAK